MEDNKREKLIYELLNYLFKTKAYNNLRLSDNVWINSCDKAYSIDNDGNIIVEDNINIEEYFDKYDKDIKINISMDSILNEYIYFEVPKGKEVCNKIDDILNNYNLYYDIGECWYMILKSK